MKIDLARYTSPFSNPWVVIGETLMLPALAVALGVWLNPLDPLWVNGSFPWVWLAPILLALRYGPFPGLAGAVLLFVAWLSFRWAGWITDDFPKLHFLGGLILIMICGEFASLWVARARRAETTQLYLDQRLEYLTHQYYLLRLSHDRLEQDLISRPVSMRDALLTLRQIVHEKGSPLPGADALLRLFAQYCQLEVASLYANEVAPTARARLATRDLAAEPVAGLGQPAPLDRQDPLLLRALDGRAMWHVRRDLDEANKEGRDGEARRDQAAADNLQKNPDAAASPPSRYLIVAPLTTFDGERLGMLFVERIPFFAFHQETLQTLDLLLGYYTDGLALARLAEPVQAAWPECPTDFASEMTRLARVARDSSIGSLIVALEFVVPVTASPPGEDDAGAVGRRAALGEMPREIQRQKRMLDVNWRIEQPDRTVLLTLMPLAGAAAAEGYIARVEQWVRQQRRQSLLEAGVFPHQWAVDGTAAADQIAALLTLCHVHEARPLRDPV